ncbi:MAG: HAD family hydrolase [Muribaculaceae bacterium]|nr:HAD family hydrolase [Muribaculaceae bacterium]
MPSLIAFDLDDTLYKERTYVASGYRTVAAALAHNTGADPDLLFHIISKGRPFGFEAALKAVESLPGGKRLSVDDMIELYRAHCPDIALDPADEEVLATLNRRGHTLLLITDGSTRHQRAKIKALGLERFFAPGNILISQETGGDKFTPVPSGIADGIAAAKGLARRFYVGDNLAKDFLWPNRRGWTSVMLRDPAGFNVFPQDIGTAPPENRPHYIIDNLKTLLELT